MPNSNFENFDLAFLSKILSYDMSAYLSISTLYIPIYLNIYLYSIYISFILSLCISIMGNLLHIMNHTI